MPDSMPRLAPPCLAPMLAPDRHAAWPASGGIAAAALIETAEGPCQAGLLRPGALLRDADGGLRMLRRFTRLPPAGAGDIVTIAPGVVADGVPARRLTLRRGQPLLLAGAVWPAGFLWDGAGVTAGPAGLPCVRLETDVPCAGLAEGLACASDHPAGRPMPDASLAALRAAIGARAGRRYGQLEGVVEALGPEGAFGWVRDVAQPGVPILIALLRDGVAIAHCFADIARPDLAMAGIGACAFRIEARSPTHGTHLLELCRAEDNAPLPGGMALLAPMRGDPDIPAPPETVAGALAALIRARLRRAPSTPN